MPLEVNYVPKMEMNKDISQDSQSQSSNHIDVQDDDIQRSLSTDSSFEDELSSFCKRLED